MKQKLKLIIEKIIKEEFLNEKIVYIPQEILNRSQKIFSYIKSNIEKLKQKSPIDYNNPFIPNNLKDIFKLNDLKGNPISVSIGLYNNPNDVGAGRMDTSKDILLINLYYLDNLGNFKELIQHELVHAIDPKLRNVNIIGKLYPKKGAEPGGSTFDRSLSKNNPNQYVKSQYEKNLEKYYKSPWEFDAFTAPLISRISNKIKKELPKKKELYKKLLYKMLQDLSTQTLNQVLSNQEYVYLAKFFTTKRYTKNNWTLIWNDYTYYVKQIKTWATKPTLYKRFLRNAYLEISKI